ncbi:MAG: hypothetical protein IJO61_02665, partial [Oscillospiraceae bacterium]|nr:hypothetical protein [Oscillospiraceae bacterium]
TCTDVVAILCHEISHLYMELMDIKYKDLKQNEEATDVTAILLGFGKIMIKGYVECSREESTGFNTSIIHKSKIGYISSRDCKIVYRLTKRIKEFELLKRQEKILLDETKKKTKEKIELSKQLYDNFIIVSQNRPATFVQQEDMLKMQDLYNKIENGYFSVQIRQFEMKVSKELSQEDLEEINKKIDLFCYEITMYNSFFSKH